MTTWQEALEAWQLRRRNAETARSQSVAIRLFFNASGADDLAGLTQDHLERYVIAQRKRCQQIPVGRRMTFSSLNKYLQALRVFLRDCQKRGYVPQLSPDAIDESLEKWPASVERPHEVVSDEDMRRMLAAAPHDAARAIIVLARYAGLRIGEIVALRACDLVHDDRGVRVVVADGKNHKRRDVPVQVEVYALIRRHAPDRRPDERLFSYCVGGARWVIQETARRAGIEKHVTPHGLRHTYAYEMAKSKTPVPVISALLGHSGYAITMRYIAHFSVEEMQQYVPHLPEF